MPAFEPTDGRFAGYRGIALRESGGSYDPARDGHSLLSDPNSLRELVHEIKTPLNAIIGFAEIIDSQLLGPADRNYRTRAAEIVAQAKLLLSAIDDLDFAAKLQADRTPGNGTDLATLSRDAVAMRQARRQCRAPRARSKPARRGPRAAWERLLLGFAMRSSPPRPLASMSVHVDNRSALRVWVDPHRSLALGRLQGGFGLRLVRGLRGSPRRPDQHQGPHQLALPICAATRWPGGPVAQR